MGGALTLPPALGCTPSLAFVYRVPPQLQMLPQVHSHPCFSFRGSSVPRRCWERRLKVPAAGLDRGDPWPLPHGHRLALHPHPQHHPPPATPCAAAGRPCPGEAPRPSPLSQPPPRAAHTLCPEIAACSGNRAGRPATLLERTQGWGPGRARDSGIARGRQWHHGALDLGSSYHQGSALPLASRVALSKLPGLSGPQFAHL